MLFWKRILRCTMPNMWYAKIYIFRLHAYCKLPSLCRLKKQTYDLKETQNNVRIFCGLSTCKQLPNAMDYIVYLVVQEIP